MPIGMPVALASTRAERFHHNTHKGASSTTAGGPALTRLRTWCGVLVGGELFVAIALHTDGAAGQSAAPVQSGSPASAIPLKDENAAIVWSRRVSSKERRAFLWERPSIGFVRPCQYVSVAFPGNQPPRSSDTAPPFRHLVSSQRCPAPLSATRGSPPAVPAEPRAADPPRPTSLRSSACSGHFSKDGATAVPQTLDHEARERRLRIPVPLSVYQGRGSSAGRRQLGTNGTATVAEERHPAMERETPGRRAAGSWQLAEDAKRRAHGAWRGAPSVKGSNALRRALGAMRRWKEETTGSSHSDANRFVATATTWLAMVRQRRAMPASGSKFGRTEPRGYFEGR